MANYKSIKAVICGQRFGRLVAGDRDPVTDKVFCQCDCGNRKLVSLNKLRRKPVGTRSCGCLRSEVCAARAMERNYKHGKTYTPEWFSWRGIIARCGEHGHKDYSGRGITVCQRWYESFENFLADMGPRPSKNHSIDRFPDNNGNYEPSNCRWATGEDQCRNRRTNVVLTFNGESLCVKEWSDRLGWPARILYQRISSGWSAEEALSITPRKNESRQCR